MRAGRCAATLRPTSVSGLVVEIAALGLLSGLWPALIAVVLAALRTDAPMKLLAWFLAGALLTTISIGVAVVLLISDWGFVTRPKPAANPVLELVGGAFLLLLAFVVARRGSRPRPAPDGPGWTERALVRGPALAFAAGVVLDLFPGVLPLIALKDIAQLGTGTAAVVAYVTGFYVLMFALVEVPLVGSLLAPERTARAAGRTKVWLDAHTRQVVVWASAGAGVYLLVRGLASLI